jgi:hypothetical protein
MLSGTNYKANDKLEPIKPIPAKPGKQLTLRPSFKSFITKNHLTIDCGGRYPIEARLLYHDSIARIHHAGGSIRVRQERGYGTLLSYELFTKSPIDLPKELI